MLRMFVHAGWDFGLGPMPSVILVGALTVLIGMVASLASILPRANPVRVKLVIAAGKALLAGYAVALCTLMAALVVGGGSLSRTGL